MPIGILGWIVAPALAPDSAEDPIGAAVTRVGVLTVGLIWQFVPCMIIVRREGGDLRWATIRQRLWPNKPRDPKTGVPWPAVVVGVAAFGPGRAAGRRPGLNAGWALGVAVPVFRRTVQLCLGSILGSPAIQAQLVGAWGFLGLFIINAVFNTFLGEELLFRGVLLQDGRRVPVFSSEQALSVHVDGDRDPLRAERLL